jgi:hypothetical protein
MYRSTNFEKIDKKSAFCAESMSFKNHSSETKYEISRQFLVYKPSILRVYIYIYIYIYVYIWNLIV